MRQTGAIHPSLEQVSTAGGCFHAFQARAISENKKM
jgi:hypothetical protein